MFSRLKSVLERLNIGSAFRGSRQIAGGIGGTFFALGGIFKVPLNQFLGGYGSAAVTAAASLVNMGYQLFNNYQSSDLDYPGNALNSGTTKLSTEMIIARFRHDQEKARDFLRAHHVTEANIVRLENWSADAEEDIQDILKQLYNDVHTDYEKYPISLVLAVMTAASHYIECMLIQVYADAKTFDYGDRITPANVMLWLVTLLAAYNALHTLVDVKRSYEQPSAAKLCNTLFSAFDSHMVNQDDERKETMPILQSSYSAV